MRGAAARAGGVPEDGGRYGGVNLLLGLGVDLAGVGVDEDVLVRGRNSGLEVGLAVRE